MKLRYYLKARYLIITRSRTYLAQIWLLNRGSMHICDYCAIPSSLLLKRCSLNKLRIWKQNGSFLVYEERRSERASRIFGPGEKRLVIPNCRPFKSLLRLRGYSTQDQTTGKKVGCADLHASRRA